MIDIRGTKREFSKIMMYKKLSLQSFDKCYYLLNSLKGEDPIFFNIGMGKLLLKRGEFQKAKSYFMEALELNPNQASAYYNLYKVNAYEKDYQEAYLNLFKYGQLIGNNGDVRLHLTLLKELIDIDHNIEDFNKNDYTISKTNYFGAMKIQDSNALEMLNGIVDDLNNRNYRAAIVKIEELKAYIQKNYIPIEVNTIKRLVEEISSKIKDYQMERLGANLSSLDAVDQEGFEQLLETLLEDVVLTDSALIRKIDEWVDVDLDKARIALKHLTYLETTPEYHYVVNRIAEKEECLNYSPEEWEEFEYLKNAGRSALKEKNYQEALQYFSAGKQVTGNNVFNYYLGKTFYRAEQYEQAKEFLLEYLKKGASKTAKALLYLEKISKRTGDFKDSMKYVQAIKEIQSIFPSNFTYVSSYNASKAGKPDADFDVVKFKASKILHFEVDDFQQETEELSLEDYYEYSFIQKLQVIVSLYRKGYIKQADKLLKDLTPTTQGEKAQIKQIQKNKKLYKNQKGGLYN